MTASTLRGRVGRRCEHGVVAVEFALLLPLLVVLLFGILAGGAAFQELNGLNAAAREGARVASIRVSTAVNTNYDPAAAVNSVVKNALKGVVNGSDATVKIEPPNACQSTTTTRVRVTVSAPLAWDVPFIGSPSATLSGKGDFRCE